MVCCECVLRDGVEERERCLESLYFLHASVLSVAKIVRP